MKAAVSGGADSVALLLVLAQLSGQEGFSLSCVHVDHGLRPTSGDDAAFVTALCGRLGVPCRVFRLHLKGTGEDEARAARYQALLDSFPEEADFALALAHHQQDQAETVLLHLFRGSGGGGLSGMREQALRPRRGGQALLWRPFLTVSPHRIRRALAEKGASWREDETNARDDYLRNYLRHQVLPIVEARLPRAQEAIARAGRILADEEAYFQQEAERFLKDERCACLRPSLRFLSYPALLDLHPALRRHVLRRASPEELTWEQTEKLCRIQPGDTVNLPSGWRAQCTETHLHFLPPQEEPPVPPPMAQAIRVSAWSGHAGDGKRTQAMPRAVFSQCELRFRRPGDVIRPLGAPGRKSMQDYFTDQKVPRPFRAHVPLLCVGNRVIWAVGVGAAEEARVSPQDDAVLLRYEGFLPWEM